MARIRTIKPEFWDSGDTARATLRARLLYIAMWNYADDYGIGDASPIRLIGFAFPNDEIPVSDYPRLLAEMSDCFSVKFFTFEKRPYYYIPEWEKHQRTEKRAKQRIPYPETDETPEKPLEHKEKPPSVGSSAESLGTPGAGTGEQGNRGTGEQGNSTAANAAVKPRKRATRIPDNFAPNPDMIQWAGEKAPHADLGTETEKFINYWTARSGKDATKLDWAATWRNWILNSRSGPTQRLDHGQRSLAKGQALLAKWDAANTPQQLEIGN